MAVTRYPNGIKMTAAADAVTENVFVESLVWSGAIVAADALTIQDAAGTENFSLVVPAAGALITQILRPFGGKSIKGITVSAMTHGQVVFVLG